jgi:hypothetical protein
MIPVSPQQPAAQPLPASPPQNNGAPPVTIDAVVQLLRNDRMRGFRIDIETDSLVEADQAQEKADATEFVTALGAFFQQFGPIVQQMPPLAPLASGLLQFAVRRHKVGQELEDLIEKTMGSVAQKLENPPPPQPDPAEQAKTQQAQIKAQAEGQKSQMEMQIKQIEAQAKQQQVAMEAQAKQQELAMQQQAQKMDMILKLLEHRQAVEVHHMEAARAERDHQLSMEVAEHKANEAKKPKADK